MAQAPDFNDLKKAVRFWDDDYLDLRQREIAVKVAELRILEEQTQSYLRRLDQERSILYAEELVINYELTRRAYEQARQSYQEGKEAGD